MTPAAPQFRDAMIAYLRENHHDICRHWFDDIEVLDVNNATVTLLVREPVQLKYLQRCCTSPFQDAAQAVANSLLAVRFIGDEQQADGRSGATSGGGHNGRAASLHSYEDDMLISPDYSFENFVVGSGNRLAHAAALAVARKPGHAYNPLFLHAGVGLGKTHLLHAICQLAMRDNPSIRIYYTSCEGFTSQFMDSVQAGLMNDFRHRYRDVDMLLIDDIHDLSHRDRTQEEFFHTFNSLYQTGRQIVLSSDAAPGRIPDLEERLTSRFNSGLVAQIERPCFETRVAILKKKAELRQMELPDDVASFVAAQIDSNIRELEGAISTLRGLADAEECPITLELARKAYGDRHAAVRSVNPSIQEIIDAVTSFYDVKLNDLLSKRRHKSVALPRQVCMWLARKHTRYSLEEIGGYFGGRDHTTVMHAIRAIECRRDGEPHFSQDIERLEHQLIAVAG